MTGEQRQPVPPSSSSASQFLAGRASILISPTDQSIFFIFLALPVVSAGNHIGWIVSFALIVASQCIVVPQAVVHTHIPVTQVGVAFSPHPKICAQAQDLPIT